MPLQGLRPYRKAVQCGGEAVDHQFAGRPASMSALSPTEPGTQPRAAPTVQGHGSSTENVDPGVGVRGSLGCWKARPASPGFDLFPGPKPVEIVGPALCGTAVLSKTAADRCI